MFDKYTEAKVFWYKDLEDFIKETYNEDIHLLRLSFLEDTHNDSYFEFTVDGETELYDIGDDVIVQKWIDNPGQTEFDVTDSPEFDWTDTAYLGPHHILHRMFKDGHISAGRYFMTVWW